MLPPDESGVPHAASGDGRCAQSVSFQLPDQHGQQRRRAAGGRRLRLVCRRCYRAAAAAGGRWGCALNCGGRLRRFGVRSTDGVLVMLISLLDTTLLPPSC